MYGLKRQMCEQLKHSLIRHVCEEIMMFMISRHFLPGRDPDFFLFLKSVFVTLKNEEKMSKHLIYSSHAYDWLKTCILIFSDAEARLCFQICPWDDRNFSENNL